MSGGGRLEISTGCALLTPDDVAGTEGLAPGPVARITVTDCGTGMDEATLARVYDPYFTTKEVGKGTGLGLATVYGIVHASGGRITAQSELGRGTSFFVDLPPAEAPTAPAAPGSLRSPRTPRIEATVLLVEDDPSVRTVLARHLEQAGCTVIAAGGGEEALAQLQAVGTVDLVVSDIRMPGMQGSDLVAALRATRPDLPVLMMSGYADESALASPVLEGIPVLEKPFDAPQLIRAVRDRLGRTAP
jgi:CheY-like chemotaxis protein